MPPESAAALEAVRAALRCWVELAGLYDTLEARVAAPTAPRLDGLAARMRELELELQPLLRVVRAAAPTAGPEQRALTDEMYRLVRGLARRQVALHRLAAAARDTTATQLARIRDARLRVAGYRAATLHTPVFASHRA